MDTKLFKGKNNEAGTFGATVSEAEESSAQVSPVPAQSPGVIVAEPGTSKEEHIFYRTKDDMAGTISGLIRDFTNLNGGNGQEHIGGTPWETLQSIEYVNNLIDAIQQGFVEETQTVEYVAADQFSVNTDRTGYYSPGRIIRLDKDGTLVGIITASGYGGGITTVTISGAEVPEPLTNVELGIQPKNYTQLLKIIQDEDSVNFLLIRNAATGDPISIEADGETNVGLDIRTKGTGRFRKPTILGIQVIAAETDVNTGDGQAFFRIPEELNGMNLIGVAGCVTTAGVTGTQDVQIRRVRAGTPQDMLSSSHKLTIDSTEVDSKDAADPAQIDTSYDDVATGDQIYVDIDAVQTTKAKGFYIEYRFALPA